MTEARKLYILLCGYEIIRKSACVRGGPRNVVLAVPICAYLIETARGLVMFDTGLDPAGLEDPVAARAAYVGDSFPAPPLVLPEHDLLAQLAAIGVAPGDVGDVVLSHAHGDHVGYLRHFTKARVTIQRVEHEAAFSAAGRAARSFPAIADPAIAWRLIEGDAELMPGVEVVFTPGHRLGHQSLVVTLPESGAMVLVGDVVDLLENFEREVLGSCLDDEAGMASLRRLKSIAAERGGTLVPLHDPGFVQEARLAPLHYA